MVNSVDEADEVWVYIPDGLGEHTARDVAYASKIGKPIKLIFAYPPDLLEQELFLAFREREEKKQKKTRINGRLLNERSCNSCQG